MFRVVCSYKINFMSSSCGAFLLLDSLCFCMFGIVCLHKINNMSLSSIAFLDDSDDEQEEDEDMLLACMLVGKYLSKKGERPTERKSSQNP